MDCNVYLEWQIFMDSRVYDSHLHCESGAIDVLRNALNMVGVEGSLVLPWENDDEEFLNQRDIKGYKNIDVALVPRLNLWGTPGWETEEKRILETAKYYRAIKIYKNYVNEVEYSLSEYNEFWDMLINIGKPLIIHFGDPADFWSYDGGKRRIQIQRNSNFKYYKNDRLKSRKQIYDDKKKLLQKYTGIDFICAHLGGFPQNTRELDEYTVASYSDTSAALDDVLLYEYDKVRDIIIRNASNILFGSDTMIYSPIGGKDMLYTRICANNMLNNLKMLTQSSVLPTSNPQELSWKVKGLGLDDNILSQILYKNYQKVFDVSVTE